MDSATRERLALRYAIALDAGDLDAIGFLLEAASTDPLLSDILSEIDRQTADEAADADRTAPVVQLAHDALHTAPPDNAPLTVGFVAALIAAESPTRDPYTQRILDASTPLPSALTASNIGRLLHEITGDAPTPRYRSAFRSAAVKARMQHEAHQVEEAGPALVAARTPRPPKRSS